MRKKDPPQTSCDGRYWITSFQGTKYLLEGRALQNARPYHTPNGARITRNHIDSSSSAASPNSATEKGRPSQAALSLVGIVAR